MGLALAGTAYASIRPLLAVGLAYKAKTLCSETFVSGRSLHDVLADLAIDDLRPLQLVRASIDSGSKETTAHFLAARRKARFDAEYGCTLSPWPTPHMAQHGSALEGTGAQVRPPPFSLRLNGGLDSVLAEAFSEPDDRRQKRTRAVVVLHRGQIVAERYALGIGPDTPMNGWSMTKSVLNALIGIAVRQGALQLESPVNLRAWSSVGIAGRRSP